MIAWKIMADVITSLKDFFPFNFNIICMMNTQEC